jgi:hypothetical protein
MKINGTCQGAELDKRTYLPGITITDVCPKCGVPYVRDMGKDYLHYPVVGDSYLLTAYCEECGSEWTMGKVAVKLTLEEVA